jgi:hypothetical protein
LIERLSVVVLVERETLLPPLWTAIPESNVTIPVKDWLADNVAMPSRFWPLPKKAEAVILEGLERYPYGPSRVMLVSAIINMEVDAEIADAP